MSIDLAEFGVTCTCGSARLAPQAVTQGSLVICAACARPARVTLALQAVPWSAVEHELEDRPHELYAMRWHRQGVAPQNRRTLPELRVSGNRFRRADRTGAVLGFVLAALLLLVLLKAVHS